jgi:GNAT superfamily N-acetyltransferase
MSSFRLRSTLRTDGQAVAELVMAMDLAILGHTDYSLAELEEEWRLLDVERDAWVVVDKEERVVGYGTLELEDGVAHTDGYVHPEAWGSGVGALLISSLEAETRRRGSSRIQTATLALDARAQELLRGYGYAETRRFWQMRIDLTEAPPLPGWPPDVSATTFDVADAAAFHAALDSAFADHWNHTPEPFADFSRQFLQHDGFDPGLCSVVRAGGEIVAGTVCMPERLGVGWVSRLFTVRDWRGRGIGAALLADAFGRFWRSGRRSVGLGVDAQNDTGAQRLYERAGMRVHLAAVVFERSLA